MVRPFTPLSGELFVSPARAILGSLAGPINQKPTPAVPEKPKYTEFDLQQIFKVVLTSKTLARDHYDKPQEKFFKARVANVYKNKSYTDCNNFI